MFDTLPANAHVIASWDWPQFQPYVDDLIERELTAQNIHQWLLDWTRLEALIGEVLNRASVAANANTIDEIAEAHRNRLLEEIVPQASAAAQQLRLKFLESGLEPEGFEIPLRNLRADVEIFREENLPLFTEDYKLNSAYEKITGSQTVVWEGEELSLAQLSLGELEPIMQDSDRAKRERAWKLAQARYLQDRQAVNDIWSQMIAVRTQIAHNAGLGNQRDFTWKSRKRFDYTPEDCFQFHESIAQVITPLLAQRYEKRRQRLGMETLRPWDMGVDPLGQTPLRPFKDVAELTTKAAAIFHKLDPELGAQFDIMREEHLLDLESRKNKAAGGYCTVFPAVKRPFIFMSAVGMVGDIRTIIHEAGHAFHVFAIYNRLPYNQQHDIPMEFAEVASIAMELLAAPYLTKDQGGFYTPEEAARARVEHLEELLFLVARMPVVDAFQHWAYTHPEAARDSAKCDAKWAELWPIYIPVVDYSGLENELASGWQRVLHMFGLPFYFVEYAMARMGAVQIWANATRNQAQALTQYRAALALGGTVTLPQLYATAGAKFAFDVDTVRQVAAQIERTIEELDPA